MRSIRLAAVPLSLGLAVTACGSDPASVPQDKEDAPVALQAGQWTVARKTTGYNTPTVTPAEYQAALKNVSEDKLCIAVDKDGLPQADALAGPEGEGCTYKDKMARKGRLIATLSCKAGAGTSEIAVEGNYTADSLTLGTTMTKTVGGKPVLRTTHDLTAKRVGNCA